MTLANINSRFVPILIITIRMLGKYWWILNFGKLNRMSSTNSETDNLFFILKKLIFIRISYISFLSDLSLLFTANELLRIPCFSGLPIHQNNQRCQNYILDLKKIFNKITRIFPNSRILRFLRFGIRRDRAKINSSPELIPIT